MGAVTESSERRRQGQASPRLVAALIGAEAGAAAGLIFAGGRLFAPLATAATGAALAPLGVVAWRQVENGVARWWLRRQIGRKMDG